MNHRSRLFCRNLKICPPKPIQNDVTSWTNDSQTTCYQRRSIRSTWQPSSIDAPPGVLLRQTVRRLEYIEIISANTTSSVMKFAEGLAPLVMAPRALVYLLFRAIFAQNRFNSNLGRLDLSVYAESLLRAQRRRWCSAGSYLLPNDCSPVKHDRGHGILYATFAAALNFINLSSF